jgi:hemerythrin
MSVEWKDNYKVGHDVIDKQHQHLFELTNALLSASEVADLRSSMMQLYKHTREHFELEEALMRQYKFAELAGHCESHNSLLSRLNVVSEGVGLGKVDKDALAKLMNDWALHHVPKDDARLASFLMQRHGTN